MKREIIQKDATWSSQEKLNEIFKLSSKNSGVLISRENNTLEFKKSFGLNEKVLQTCAAFANAKGGNIVFGVEDSPHKLLGLDAKSMEKYNAVGSHGISSKLSEFFAPELSWDIIQHDFQDKVFLVFHINESLEKPVIANKAGGDIGEGDIYYRYRGITARIKYPELRAIFDHNKESLQQDWMRFLSKIVEIGMDRVGVLNMDTLELSGKGQNFFIDEGSLDKLKFIKEGRFVERNGAPAITLAGTVYPIKNTVTKTKGIRMPDIIQDFLLEKHVKLPVEYIKQIAFENTAYLPIFYYLKMSKLDAREIIPEIEKVNTRNRAKLLLLQRLQGLKKIAQFPLPSEKTKAGQMKKRYRDGFLAGSLPSNISNENLIYALQSIRSLSREELQRPKIKKNLLVFLYDTFTHYYKSSSPSAANEIRMAIAWIDTCLYGN